MKVIDSSARILSMSAPTGEAMLKDIEYCARICYRSEGSQTEDSYKKLLPALLASGHMSVFEHGSITVEFTTDIGTNRELTRGRHISPSVESTRYCNYSKDKFYGEISFVAPEFDEGSNGYLQRVMWENGMCDAERRYFSLLNVGFKPQIARDALPLATACTYAISANPRAWRHVLLQRTAKNCHPKLLKFMVPLLGEFQQKIPILYDDIVAYEDGAVAAKKPQ